MNPTQYKEAMRQRALERRVELNRAAESAQPLPGRSLGATYPPRTNSSFATGRQQHKLVPTLQLQGDEREGGFAAACVASTAGGGRFVEGFGVGDVPKELLYSNDDGLSPLAPGPLAGYWDSTSSDHHIAGFDKQAGPDSAETGSNVSPGDIWGEDGGDVGFQVERQVQVQRQQQQEARVLDWSHKFPGETSITQGVRLYLTNLDHNTSHEDNCAMILHQILEHVATEELDVLTLKTRHKIKIEAFLRSVVLSVPAKTWQQSVRGAFARTAPAGIGISPGHGYQISKEELTFRMSLFVAMMKAERDGGDESDVALDALRVESVVRSYAANAAEILPLQHPARTLLPPLLFCTACEVLHVRLLGPEVRAVCRQIVSDYEARAKLWMSPAQNAERFLHPLVTEFLSWLRANREILYQGSATEGLLRSIDKDLRSSLKTQVYRSPEHFLQVLGSLSALLTDMPLPSYDPSGGDDHPFDVSQTLKDVSRERFYLNNEPTDPSRCRSEIRALLLKAAVQRLKRPAFERRDRPADAATLQPNTGGPRVAESSSSAAAAVEPMKPIRGASGADGRSSNTSVLQDTEPIVADADPAKGCAVSFGLVSGGNGVAGGCGDAAGGASGGDKTRGSAKGAQGAGGDTPASPLEVYADQCAWRVLHAASRTASGGDSFFVVQDLFGGEGVLVKMATAATEPIRIRTKGLAVRVTTVDKHDIYHVSDVDINSGASPLPLMTITTTMKEVIQFAPFVETPLIRRKSGQTAEKHASGNLQQPADMQEEPSHARSGRFITISAALPDYPEDHLDAAAGVLEAPPHAPLSDLAHVGPQSQIGAATTNSGGIIAADASVILAGSDYAGRISASSHPPAAERKPASSAGNSHVLQRRPSLFNSPPPAPTPANWRRHEGQGSESSRGSFSGEVSDGDSTRNSDEGAVAVGKVTNPDDE